jgi:signal transduction histidine kinase
MAHDTEPSARTEPITDVAAAISESSAARRAVLWYLAWSVVVLLVVSAGVVAFSARLARQEALRDAEDSARAVAASIVEPLTGQEFLSQSPDALALMNQAMVARTRDGSIQHVKIWGDAGSGEGTVLWSSEKPLEGQTFPMEPEDYALFGTNEAVAEVSDLSKEENVLERSADELVEVYVGMTDRSGQPLLFEAYLSAVGLHRNTRELAIGILPLPLLALLLFALLTFPIAISLARRVDRDQVQMRRVLVNAVASSDLERRRISQRLHDDVIQDLAGVGYALASDARQAPPSGEFISASECASCLIRQHVEQASGILRADITTLRRLMEDIYPPDLQGVGLADSIQDLIATQDLSDAEFTYEVVGPLTPSPLTARLAYRVTREILRNAAEPAHPSHVRVRLTQSDGFLHLEVVDDGGGFDTTAEGPRGHMGLRLIRETVADAGGHMEIESTPGAGTTTRATLPL